MRKSVLVTRNLPEAVLARARETLDLTVLEDGTPFGPEEMRAALAERDGMIPTLGDMFTREVFEGVDNPRCRILANFGVGYNHIDVEAARAAGITVTNTPGAVTDATADIAVTLMLMSARRAGEGERILRAGAWTGWVPTQLLGQHVTGKTVGIVGMGRIGQAVARRCLFGFAMKVVYCNRSPKTLDFEAQALDSIEAVAAESDFVVIAVPGGAETRHLIGADALAAMRPHAHLVNVSRGDVVEESALVAALRAGSFAGAGLDVYEFEPEVPQALREMENVTLLPHLGTATLEVREAMGFMALDNLLAALDGRTPPNAL